MAKMIEVMIDSIRVSLTSQQRIVLLRSLETERYLPIWIGPYETESITIALQEIELARPQAHDLLLLMLKKLDAHLRRVEITALKDDVFYGNLVVEKDGQLIDIDARPSDSIAMAVRAHVPILLAEEILETAGIIISPDIQQEATEAESPTDQSSTTTREETDEANKRLSIFEDFLQNLDIDDGSEKPADEGGGDVPPDPPDKK
jgi:bifunctional DNase/RNase